MSDELSVDDLVKPQPDDQMTNHAEQHSLIADLIVAKDKLQQEIEARVEAGETIQQQILDSIDSVGGVHVSDDPPDPANEGDLWYDTKRLEIFIRYQEGWVTATALGAALEETDSNVRDLTEQVAELQTQLDASEAKQAVFASQLDDITTHIADIRTDLENRITVSLWRFVGYDVDPTTLGSGEFCLHKNGLEGTNPLRIWMSVFDPGGNYWKTSTKLSANYASSFQVSIDEPNQAGQYHGLIKSVRLNQNPADHGDYESGKAHLIDLNYVYTRRDMREGYFYNINIPGYLPLYTKFSRVKNPLIRSDVEIANASSEAMQVNSQEEIQGASDTEMEGGN